MTSPTLPELAEGLDQRAFWGSPQPGRAGQCSLLEPGLPPSPAAHCNSGQRACPELGMLGVGATFCSHQAGSGEASCSLPGRGSLGGTAAQGTFCQRSSRIANEVLEAWFLIRSTLAFGLHNLWPPPCESSAGLGHREGEAGRRKYPRLQPFTSLFPSWLSISLPKARPPSSSVIPG